MYIRNINGAKNPIIETIEELNTLALNPELDCHSPEIIASNFYQVMQTATELSIPDSGLAPATLILLAKIASISPTLHTIDLENNKLGEHAVGVAAYFSQSKTLHTLNLGWNHLSEHAVGVAAHLSQSPTLHTLNLENNKLDEHAVGVAGIINNHNQEVQEVQEWYVAMESLNQIYGLTGLEYGSVSSILELVGKSTGENFPENVIKLYI